MDEDGLDEGDQLDLQEDDNRLRRKKRACLKTKILTSCIDLIVLIEYNIV